MNGTIRVHVDPRRSTGGNPFVAQVPIRSQSPGEQIRALREAMRLTRARFALQIGCKTSTLYNWEHDVNFPGEESRKRIREIAEMFAEVCHDRRDRVRPPNFNY